MAKGILESNKPEWCKLAYLEFWTYHGTKFDSKTSKHRPKLGQ